VAIEDEEYYVSSDMASRDFLIPMDSGLVSGVAQPAVSMSSTGMPSRETRSVTRSRVVPGVAVDDGAVALNEAIEKRGFTNVWAARRWPWRSLRGRCDVGKGLFERGEGDLDCFDLGGDLSLWEEVDVVFGEVDAGFHCGDEAYKFLLYWGYLTGREPPSCLAATRAWWRVVDSMRS